MGMDLTRVYKKSSHVIQILDTWDLGPVYMEAGLARLARQPGWRDEFLLCLYEKISSRLPGQFSCFDIDLTVVKNSLRQYL
jgi:hypothetical protein